jgi:hypothetical protein
MHSASGQYFDDEAVYRRNTAGQRALLEPAGMLSRDARRLLSLFNGYTPLRLLLDLLGGSLDAMSELKLLIDSRLVERVHRPRTGLVPV